MFTKWDLWRTTNSTNGLQSTVLWDGRREGWSNMQGWHRQEIVRETKQNTILSSFIQQTLNKCLLCSGSVLGSEDITVEKAARISVLRELVANG